MADDNLQMHLELEGKSYRMHLGDFTGADDLAIFQKVGKTIADIFQGDITLFTVAALLWRWRVNHGEPNVTFEQVNSKMTFDAINVDAGETSAPEA